MASTLTQTLQQPLVAHQNPIQSGDEASTLPLLTVTSTTNAIATNLITMVGVSNARDVNTCVEDPSTTTISLDLTIHDNDTNSNHDNDVDIVENRDVATRIPITTSEANDGSHNDVTTTTSTSDGLILSLLTIPSSTDNVPREPDVDDDRKNVETTSRTNHVVPTTEMIGSKQLVDHQQDQAKQLNQMIIAPSSLPPPPDHITASAITLQSLPLDALHNIASYLTPNEWCNNFGILNKQSLLLSRTILQRVYMHAYKCLIELITAFKYYHQYEDCLELAAIYVNNGIPIYPYSFGHAYHTMYWKMNIEINESSAALATPSLSSQQPMHHEQQQQQPNRGPLHNHPLPMNNNHNNNLDPNGTTATTTTTSLSANIKDPFYGPARINQRIGWNFTYLEEKCRFYSSFTNHTVKRNHNNNNNGVVTSTNEVGEFDDNGEENYGIMASTTTITATVSSGDLNKKVMHHSNICNKVPVLIHQHLYDRHFIHHEYYTNRQNGAMNTPSINLSADLFHPPISSSYHQRRSADKIGNKKINSIRHETVSAVPSSSINNGNTFRVTDEEGTTRILTQQPHVITDQHNTNASERNEILVRDGNSVIPSRQQDYNMNDAYNNDRDHVQGNQANEAVHSIELQQPNISAKPSTLSDSDIEIYSTTSMIADTNNQHLQEIRQHLLSRFATYQRRLESFLSKGDIYSYDEGILDIWDEFFPHTAGIHYYDLETPVPRLTNIYKFLTKPCPKSIGTVQCEIERIKITNRGGKGGGMKGRLFPTYEYRLFIRHRPLPSNHVNTSQIHNNVVNNNAPNEADENNNDNNFASTATGNSECNFVRRDTVLLVAKNRGRKHTEHNGIVPMSNTSNKKGSNNYYLYMPQQMDIDEHFRNCNTHLLESKKYVAKMEPNGVSRYPVMLSLDYDAGVKSNTLLGRLQSNFIGTEFQIFIPRIQKLSSTSTRKLMEQNSSILSPPFHSDDDIDYDSGMSSDTNINPSVRRSRFSRFRRHNAANGTNLYGTPTQITATSTTTATNQFYSTNSDSGSVVSTPILEHRTVKRTLSSPENLQSYQGHSTHRTRVSRRAIANDVNTSQPTSSLSSSPPPRSTVLLEEEAGVITYTANLLGSRPRIMDVCVPKVSPFGDVGVEWRQYLESCDDDIDDCRMLSCFRQLQHRRDSQDQQQQVTPIPNNNNNDNGHGMNHDTENDAIGRSYHGNTQDTDFGLLALQNRPPWWNVELGSFVLNFGGRVSVASVKNFQLCERNNQDVIMLQFGRIHGRHSFTMDYRHPLTAVQAFSIAISSLQSKISFG